MTIYVVGTFFLGSLIFYFIYKYAKIDILFFLLIFIGQITVFLSSLFIETGVYITEQQRISFQTGSTVWLLIYNLLFFVPLVFACNKYRSLFPVAGNRVNMKFQKSASLMLAFVVCAIFILYVNLILTGIPLFSDHINRFNFWAFSAIPFLNKLLGNTALPLVIILGVVYGCSRGKYPRTAKISLYCFLFTIIYYFLLGQKFSMQLLAFSFFIPPFAILAVRENGVSPRDIINRLRWYFFVILLIMLVFTYLVYTFGSLGISDAQGGALAGMVYRVFALQGHVWWGIHYSVFHEEVYGLGHFLGNSMGGMESLMRLVAPDGLVDSYLEAGVRFSMGYPAIGILLFGKYKFLFLQIIIGLFYGFFIGYVQHKILKKEIFIAFLGMFILSVFYQILSMGEVQLLWSYRLILAFCLLVLSEAINLSLSTKRKISIKGDL